MTGSLVIVNGNVLMADGSMRVCDILIEGGKICEVGTKLDCDARLDAKGCYVLPGLIDLHTHGIRDMFLNTADIAEFAKAEAEFGATSFCATLFAAPYGIAETMERVRTETHELKAVPQLAGFRLESPYLAGTGAGVNSDLAPISDDTTQMLLRAAGGHIRIWDVSPELPGSTQLICELTDKGILCSMAHTRCSIEQAREVVDAGARLVTHLFDTFYQPPMADPGVYPAGLVDYLLIEDRLTCEIIADGTHVHPILVEKALRCKTPEKIAFITDSNLGAGLSPGEYDLPNDWGRVVVNGPNNGVRLVDREMGLAGSALTPIDAFRNAIRLFGQDISTASRMCSKTPSDLLKLNKGDIAPGRDADIIILDNNLQLVYTIVAGSAVYST